MEDNLQGLMPSFLVFLSSQIKQIVSCLDLLMERKDFLLHKRFNSRQKTANIMLTKVGSTYLAGQQIRWELNPN